MTIEFGGRWGGSLSFARFDGKQMEGFGFSFNGGGGKK